MCAELFLQELDTIARLDVHVYLTRFLPCLWRIKKNVLSLLRFF